MSTLQRLLALFGTFTALCAAGLDITWTLRLLLVLLAAASALTLILWRSRVPKHDYEEQKIEPAQSNEQRRLAAVESASLLKVSEAELRFLAFVLLYPDLTRKRVNEAVNLDRNPITKSATMNLSIPSELIEGTKVAYVPVVRPVKRRLIRSLEVTDNQGTHLQTLNHEESVALTVRLAEVLLRKSFGLDETVKLPDKVGGILACFIDTALRVPQRDTVTSNSERRNFREKVVKELESLAAELQVQEHTKWKELRELLKLVSCNYVVIAVTEPTKRLSITYQYELLRQLRYISDTDGAADHPPKWADSLRGGLRRLARTEAARVRMSVNKGNSCDSYHLSIVTAKGSHIASIGLMDGTGRPMPKPPQPSHDLSQGYFRVGGKSSATAHLYARGLVHCPVNVATKLDSRPAFLELSIFETPPGAMGRATVAASIITVLVYLVGLRAESGTELNIDTFALIGGTVALCLALVAFVRGSLDAETHVIALLAFVSLALTLVVTIMASILLATDLKGPEYELLSLFRVHSLLWYTCCCIALGNLLWSLAAVVIRMRRFYLLAARESLNLDTDVVEDIITPSGKKG